MVTHVRSTLLTASRAGIRTLGWEERYLAALPAALHVQMRTLPPSVWVPLDIAREHYSACDRMDLSSEEMRTMGESVSLRTQQTFVGTLGRIAAGAGATPWHVIAHIHRIWGRIFQGGDHIAYKLGPKDVDLVTFGCSLIAIPYFRTAMCAYNAAVFGVTARTVHWRELPQPKADDVSAMRISWV